MLSQSAYQTRVLVLMSLFTALTAVCAQVVIPIGAVPVTLSLLPPLLCALLMRGEHAFLTMCTYILLGLCGVPVFSGFSGGAGKLLGVTGGYILGYLPCVAVITFSRQRWRESRWKKIMYMAMGVLTCYFVGTLWFMAIRHASPGEVLALCVLPFLPFDAVKILLAAWLSDRLRFPLKRLLGYDPEGRWKEKQQV